MIVVLLKIDRLLIESVEVRNVLLSDLNGNITMINNKLISSGTIIAKVIADLDLKEDQIRITDIREWIQECVLKIGAIQ
nr:MAG TPA: hypothetical protein [Podoviridae sp. ctY3D12]